MKTDRELLLLAARAVSVPAASVGPFWNPLVDSNQMLQLAAKLGMHLDLSGPYVNAWIPGGAWQFASVPKGDSPEAAARRAVLLVAAQVSELL